MGFLSRLFGQSLKEDNPDIFITGTDEFDVQVVGNRYYQTNLTKICAGCTEDHVTTAKLVHDNYNEYDNKAIRVEISQEIVGHLSRSEAQHYRDRMCSNGHAGLTAACKAKITAAWGMNEGDREGSFCVYLDLPSDFVEPPSVGNPKYKSPERLKIKPGQLRYEIYTRAIEGKSDEQIFEELVEIGQYDQSTKKSDALNYIEYFRDKMER